MVELLVVIVIMALLALGSGPALQAIKSSGGVSRAIAEASGTLTYARTYAMGNHTYVRVAIGQSTSTAAASTSATILVPIYSVDGSLDADSVDGMTDPSKWRSLTKPVILGDFAPSKNLRIERFLDASNYVSPDETDIPGPVSFRIGERGAVSCRSFIQFNPDGAARVLRAEPVRFIDLALDKPAPQNGRNPFVVRLSGLNGSISILRKGEGIQ